MQLTNLSGSRVCGVNTISSPTGQGDRLGGEQVRIRSTKDIANTSAHTNKHTHTHTHTHNSACAHTCAPTDQLTGRLTPVLSWHCHNSRNILCGILLKIKGLSSLRTFSGLPCQLALKHAQTLRSSSFSFFVLNNLTIFVMPPLAVLSLFLSLLFSSPWLATTRLLIYIGSLLTSQEMLN